MKNDSFKLTYATMFDPPEVLHVRFEEAMTRVRTSLGKEYGMLIDGQERSSDTKMDEVSPADTELVLASFQEGGRQDVDDAVAAARQTLPVWSRTPWQERVRLVRKVALLIEQRLFDMSASMVLSVGKNRMEAIGEVAETADLITYCCDEMERNNGFAVEMKQDPIPNQRSDNMSVMKPHGVWLVISPFNYPTALSGGPMGAALVAGNTVVIKPSSDTPWTSRLLAECFRDAGIPGGVVNFVTGPGDVLGQALISSPDVDGVTFTGSYEVGMKIFRERAQLDYVRPVILEMGGKNPAIVSRNADPDGAALGIMRSAFGLQGQKCSACSRAYVEEPMFDEVVERIVELTKNIVVGDPADRDVYMGPVINRAAYDRYTKCVEELSSAGEILVGGHTLSGPKYAKGYFCAPTVVSEVPLDHDLWKQEMFLPILMVAAVPDLNEAVAHANSTVYGLTSGFYGSDEEAQWFFDNSHSGVAYANRPSGATTGAGPGYQPFGGWKGSGASGRNAGGHYYLGL
ncbi:MAG: aldehyde dehydrogenase family protein [Deltaproteobacteria bacterium]